MLVIQPLPLHGGPSAALFGAFIPLALLLHASSAQARFLEHRRVPAAEPAQKHQLLLAKSYDPGYFHNYGVRSGPPQEDMGSYGDDGSEHDATMPRNMFTSDTMAYNFPFLDNMMPVAPMDSVKHGDGAYGMDAKYVSEYLNPDGFPGVVGKGCMCKAPDGPTEKIECHCGKESDNDHYTWLKDTPVTGTKNYTLTPADISYRAGNYWEPNVRGGIASPADSLPAGSYPNQAAGDRIWPLPASAAGDRIGIKYARYLDQVHDRAQECDTVSKRCTVPCKPGDAVTGVLGNTHVDA